MCENLVWGKISCLETCIHCILQGVEPTIKYLMLIICNEQIMIKIVILWEIGGIIWRYEFDDIYW